ncbi:MAG: hypothetical protein JNL39_13930 [Opitutaceae bacterium]|nr:hypothetical protein [Opitutaceae bacterium]
MSLNRCEQRVFDYLQRHQDERHHWQGKFQRIAREAGDERVAVDIVEPQLWDYYLERGSVVKSFREAVAIEGAARTSMKNLAELLMRLWIQPQPRKKSSDATRDGG